MENLKDGIKRWQGLRRVGDEIAYGYPFVCTEEIEEVEDMTEQNEARSLDEVINESITTSIQENRDEIIEYARQTAIERAKKAVEQTGVFDKIEIGVSPTKTKNREASMQKNTSKPGIKTSEFWMTIITGIITILIGLGVITADLGQSVSAIAAALIPVILSLLTGGYAVSRGIAKKNDNYIE